MEFEGRGKRALLCALVAGFLVQTGLVYADRTQAVPMSTQAEAGRRIWQRSSCQACHQLYGMGGFLGPDLTNAAATLPPQRVRALLADGSRQMPAFGIEDEEADAVLAFLAYMDSTGQGQVTPSDRLPWWVYRE